MTSVAMGGPARRSERSPARTLQLAVLGLMLSGCASQFVPEQTAALAAACSATPGCAATAATHRQAAVTLPSRSAVELTATPFFPQTPLHCGPAALATVLGAAGRSVTPERLVDRIFLPGRGGTLIDEMMTGAWREGLLAVQLSPRLDALLAEVDAGTPVVVLQNLSLPIYPRWHYAVVVGYDLPAGNIILRSGEIERLVRPLTTFERTWERGKHWAMAVVTPGTLPVSATRDAAVLAAVGFERNAPPALAERVYLSILARWPDDPAAAMGVGNVRHAAGDLAGAEQAFAALAERTGSAVAWNNLAMTRLERGDRAGALTAAQRAVDRAQAAEPQWLEAARATLSQVQGRPVRRPSGRPRPEGWGLCADAFAQ